LTYLRQVRRLRSLAVAALKLYPVRVAKMKFINHGENTTFQITAVSGKQFLLRICRNDYHSAEALNEEIEWLQRLLQGQNAFHKKVHLKLQTPNPVLSRHGCALETVTTDDIPEGRKVVLFRWIDGQFLRGSVSEEKFRTLGNLIAGLHEQTKGCKVRHRRYWDAEGLLGKQAKFGSIDSLSLATSSQQLRITKARRSLLKTLKKYEKKYPERMGLIHADLHFGNFLFNSQGLGVIDFDDCGFGFLAYDLAIPLIAFERHAGMGIMQKRKIKAALVAGYRELAPWDQADDAVLEALIMARRLLMLGWLNSRSDNPRLAAFLKKAIPRVLKAVKNDSL
jgi:Ser/Thr protein kinase RdoA (MazF antagonist)